MPRPSKRKRAVAFLALLLAFLALFPPTPASAQESLDVRVGFGGRHRSGADLLVQIEVRADRLIAGTLVITGRNQEAATTVVLPIEVAGGSSKRYLAVLPRVFEWEATAVVQLIEQGEVSATATGQANGVGEDELIGVLPSLATDLPPTAALAVPLGGARLFPIDNTYLAAGSGAVSSLDAIVATAADLDALSTGERDALRTWVSSGGSLLVDEATGPLSGFDEVTTRRTSVGMGYITLLGDVLSSGAWDGALPPTPLRQNADSSPMGEITGDVTWIGGPLANSLAQDAGFGLPSMNLVLPLMAAYVLIAGPIVWLFLTRTGRGRLLWLALPGLALLFTLGVWFAGTTIRNNTSDAHATVIDLRGETATAESTILRSSRNGGTTGIDLEPNWQPARSGNSERFGPTGNASTTVRPSLNGSKLEATLDAGAFALFSATGPALEYVEAIDLEAVSVENGKVVVSVTNTLAIDLEEVVLFAGTAGHNVGTVGAGATIDLTLDQLERDPRFGEPVEFVVWRDALNASEFGPFGGNSSTEVSVVNIDLWSSYLTSNVGRARPIGEITLAAWTDQLSSPIGDNVENGRTLIVAHSDVEIRNGQLTDLANQRHLLRSPDQENDFNAFGPVEFNGAFVVSSVWRFDIADDIDTNRLALELPTSIEKVELWNGDEWLEFVTTERGFYGLPEGVIVDGSLYARPFINFDRTALLGRSFTLQTIDGDQEIKVLPVDAEGEGDGE